MKILTCEQTRIIEKNQTERGSSYFQLMNNAGVQVGKALISQLGAEKGSKVAVLCGKGNNGGDGFIAAQYLKSRGIEAYALLVDGEPRTEDSIRAMEQALSEGVRVMRIWEHEQRVKDIISTADYVIDAVYGIGFRGALNRRIKPVADLVNSTHSRVLSVDLPSGVNCDDGSVENTAFRAGKKLSRLMPKKSVSANKGSVGTLSVVCGSYGMAGAAQMCIQSALRSGTGMVKGIVPSSIYPVLAGNIPQAVFLPCEKPDNEIIEQGMQKSNAVVIGCGMGNTPQTRDAVEFIIKSSNIPIVIDADGINAIASEPELLTEANAPIIITPHPGEMARLLNTSVSIIQNNRLTAAVEFSKKYKVITVLKGAYTVVAHPNGKSLVNPTGNNGMAKAGSGDVLAGMIGSFLSVGMEPFNAALSGVYCHGYAGDLAEKQFGNISMLATDIIDMLPAALRTIY